MTLTTSLLLDIVILVLLASCLISGLRRGLILSVCDLLAVVLALLGGWYLCRSPQLLSELEPFLAQRLTPALSALTAKALLFLAGFLLVLMLWRLLCHLLHLVAKLPGLHGINKALGGLLGLVKGYLILLVARWALCDFLGWIPPEVAAESRMLLFLSSLPLPTFLGF